jgi:hypothetical protein
MFLVADPLILPVASACMCLMFSDKGGALKLPLVILFEYPPSLGKILTSLIEDFRGLEPCLGGLVLRLFPSVFAP